MIGHGGQTSTQVIIMTDPPRSYAVIPPGESDHKESGHWDDQAEKLFSKAQAAPTYFLDEPGLLPHVTSTKVFRRVAASPGGAARRGRGNADPNASHRVDFDPLKGPPMRIVGGSARGKKLLVVPGDGTRPILDRVKTALFDILRPRIAGMEVLDLFAGSGSVGIEAPEPGCRALARSSIAARRPSPRSSGTSRPPVSPTATSSGKRTPWPICGGRIGRSI